MGVFVRLYVGGCVWIDGWVGGSVCMCVYVWVCECVYVCVLVCVCAWVLAHICAFLYN